MVLQIHLSGFTFAKKFRKATIMAEETTTTTETTPVAETPKFKLSDHPVLVNYIVFGIFGVIFMAVMGIMFLDMVKLM